MILFKVGGTNAELLVMIAGALFVAPPFLLSGLGGEWADRYDKALVARRLKLAEVAAAGLLLLGFALSSIPILFVALVLFSTIAALFAPLKYGILPDQLARDELPAGNALVEGGTFIAILLGTIVGGLASALANGVLVYGALVTAFAVLCYAASCSFPARSRPLPSSRSTPTLSARR